MEKITKMIVINSSKLLPSDVAMKLYETKDDIMVKETCFGIMVSGERAVLDPLLSNIRKLDPYGIFIKERGFAPGEPFRCRATRRGGARPGFHNLETEDKILPHIANALKSLDRGEIPGPKKQTKKLDIDKLKAIIKETEVSK
ncbi:MAG: methanogenesis marker 6 protein [Candidatus Methanoperedens sp.]|nr:methanogenesis marker 6 protein [Candidatus Methanoperedens sp.]